VGYCIKPAFEEYFADFKMHSQGVDLLLIKPEPLKNHPDIESKDPCAGDVSYWNFPTGIDFEKRVKILQAISTEGLFSVGKLKRLS